MNGRVYVHVMSKCTHSWSGSRILGRTWHVHLQNQLSKIQRRRGLFGCHAELQWV